MAKKRTVYVEPGNPAGEVTPIKKVVLGARGVDDQDNPDKYFEVTSYTLNMVTVEQEDGAGEGSDDAQEEVDQVPFPGNIAPEGYFYSPFHEVMLKELSDELQYVRTRRINFMNKDASAIASADTFYYPDTGMALKKDVYVIKIVSHMPYNFILGQPFCIYDVLADATYRGHLAEFKRNDDNGSVILHIETQDEIYPDGFGTGEQSRYIIAMLDENAPEYAEYLPTTNRLVWRAPKKMSELNDESPIYNMPFTNGRLYIHENVNVFVRRQDPDNRFHLMKPTPMNPLRRFRVEGNPELDFDQIKYITDSLIDAC